MPAPKQAAALEVRSHSSTLARSLWSYVTSLTQLAIDACSLLNKTPLQSPTQALPQPLHPIPVDWDARPLPLPPANNVVAQDEDDFEVCPINSSLVGAGLPALKDNLFLPP